MRADFKFISMGVFCAFAIKLLLQPEVGAFQAVSLLITTLFVAFYEYKASIEQIKAQQSQIDELKKEISGLRIIQTDIITNISSIKVMQNIKSQNSRQSF